MTMQSFIVSWPPSTNAIWRSVRGRNILSEAYRSWRNTAGKQLLAQCARPIEGPVAIKLELCSPTRPFDLDNRCKACLDLLTSHGVIASDDARTVKHLSVCEGSGFTGARLTVTS
jgi:Holliday junction resolvase RusA-like endonuclease